MKISELDHFVFRRIDINCRQKSVETVFNF